MRRFICSDSDELAIRMLGKSIASPVDKMGLFLSYQASINKLQDYTCEFQNNSVLITLSNGIKTSWCQLIVDGESESIISNIKQVVKLSDKLRGNLSSLSIMINHVFDINIVDVWNEIVNISLKELSAPKEGQIRIPIQVSL